MDLHQNYPLLTHQSVPVPTAPPSNNIHTLSQPENLHMRQHPNYPLTLVIKSEVLSTPAQKENLQELLSAFNNLGTSQHVENNSPLVTTTQEWVETSITHTPQDLHLDINYLAALSNTSVTMNSSISATTALRLNLYERTPLFPDYDLDLSPSMLQYLVVKW